eukprot:COSAG01_NODE_9778_length_2346_cov_3.760125_3_plen_128_part_00
MHAACCCCLLQLSVGKVKPAVLEAQFAQAGLPSHTERHSSTLVEALRMGDRSSPQMGNVYKTMMELYGKIAAVVRPLDDVLDGGVFDKDDLVTLEDIITIAGSDQNTEGSFRSIEIPSRRSRLIRLP